MEFNIRPIEEKDNLKVATIIRDCLTEYGYAGRMDTAWGDPHLERFSEVYVNSNNAYWVAENKDGEVIAGVGIGPLDDEKEICELQKMYCKKEYRGSGVSKKLLDIAMDFAKKHYKKCYLETCDNMFRAMKFYKNNGFEATDETIGNTGHSGCESHFIKQL